MLIDKIADPLRLSSSSLNSSNQEMSEYEDDEDDILEDNELDDAMTMDQVQQGLLWEVLVRKNTHALKAFIKKGRVDPSGARTSS